MDPRLARFVPPDFEHIEKFPLRAAMISVMPATPVSVGINWYSNFDDPIKGKDGKWWIGRGDLGWIRGGHCVCMPHVDNEPSSWYTYYNQGMEGACVGFGSSRMMSLLNRKQYDARWLWDRAKEIDDWDDTNPGDNNGTSVRAAMDILRTLGHKPKKGAVDGSEGIWANRWATNIDDLFSVLQNASYKKAGAIPFFNSWGKDYPRKVWMPCETWDRLMKEDGEFTMITDR